jgi:lysophospholipase L1-like esterase
MRTGLRAAAAAFCAAVCAFAVASASAPQGWTGSWATSEMPIEAKDALDAAVLRDATLRQTLRLSLGGDRLRITLSNAFGRTPLHLVAVHVARAVTPGRAGIDPATDRTVTFGGRGEVIIPAGAIYISDPVALKVPARADLAISIRFDGPPAGVTGHPGSRTTSYLVPGDHVGDADFAADAIKVDHWYQIAAVEVETAKPAVIVAALGDSITDGRGSTTNGNDRWTDALSERLLAAGRRIGVINLGIGGNRLLNDGLGPNVLARLDRDVLVQNGVRVLIVLEGVNDLGTLTQQAPVGPAEHAALVDRMIDSYRQIVVRAHQHGIKVIGATITPYGGTDVYHPDAANEADRQAVNAWIRAPGNFDGVADFDAALRDPDRPDRLKPVYDCGDRLHPSPAGFKAMAAAVPLGLLGH